MSKVRFLFVLVLIACLMLSACSAAPVVDEPAEQPTEEETTEEPVQEPAEQPTEEPVQEEPVQEGPTKEEMGAALKIIFLVPGSIDRPVYKSAYEGLKRVEETFGSNIGFFEMSDDDSNWDASLASTLEEDWDIIVTDSNVSGAIAKFAAMYPDKMFIVLHEYQGPVPPNVASLGYRMNEAAFLAGACAASVTQSDMALANDEPEIGFLGGMNIPLINDFLLGYIEGAQYVNGDIKVHVSYAENFGDPELGKSLAADMYDNGADVVFNVAGYTGQGVFDAAKIKNGYAIGVDVDQAMLMEGDDPEKAALILTSVVRKQGNALFWAIDQYLEGTLQFGIITPLGIAEQAVGLAKNNYYDTLDADIKTLLEELEEKIFVGEITVSSAFGMETAQVMEIVETVKP